MRQRRQLEPIEDYQPLGLWKGHDPVEYLTHIFHQLGRLGLDTHDINQVSTSLRDLQEPFNPGAFERLLDISDWNIGRIAERAEDLSRFEQSRFKPRIDLFVEITSKDNLRAFWHPTGFNYFHGDRGDWLNWRLSEEITFSHRPDNEFLFIRDIGLHRHMMDWNGDHRWPKGHSLLCGDLIGCAAAWIRELAKRLGHATVVNERSALDFETTTIEDPADRWVKRDITVPLGFDVVEPSEHERREDKRWLERFPASYGVKPDEFLELSGSSKTRTAFKKRIEDESGKRQDFADLKATEARLRKINSKDDNVVPLARPYPR